MIALFLMAAAAAASAPTTPATPAAAAPAKSAMPGTARSVVEAQLRSAPREHDRRALSADEADAIYARYLASIGRRPDRAPDNSGGTWP